ncbi:MAG: hypothetical protein ABIR80_21355 [Opitutaceae bacterium]
MSTVAYVTHAGLAALAPARNFHRTHATRPRRQARRMIPGEKLARGPGRFGVEIGAFVAPVPGLSPRSFCVD